MVSRWLLASFALVVLLGCGEPASTSAPKPGTAPPPSTASSDTSVSGAPIDQETLTKVQQSLESGNFEEALRLVDVARSADPQNPQLTLAYAQIAQMRGAELAATDRTQANALFIRCAEMMRNYQKQKPDLSEQERLLLGGALYNEACVYAVENKSDKAIQSLREAVAAGFTNADTLENDPDWEALRRNADFQAVLKEMSGQSLQRTQEMIKQAFAENKPFPFSFSLPDLQGKSVSLSDYRGKVVIVDIWGTWCPPCRQEIPHFIELVQKYRQQGLEVIGVNYEQVPQEEVKQTILAFVQQNKVNYPCLIGDDATRGQVPEFRGFPTTLFLDRDGTVRWKSTGYQPYEVLESAVIALLSEPGKSS